MSQIELNKYKKMFFIKHFIFYFSMAFIVSLLARKFGLSKDGLALPVDWDELLYFIPWTFIVSLVISFLWALYETKIPESLMCDKCFKYKKYDRKYNCECGGHFVDFKYMKYIIKK